MDFGIASVTSITVICFLVAECVKAFDVKEKWIPVLVGIVGAVFGVVGKFVVPDFPAQDIVSAIAVGIVSGLASTGAHQIYKQINQDGDIND